MKLEEHFWKSVSPTIKTALVPPDCARPFESERKTSFPHQWHHLPTFSYLADRLIHRNNSGSSKRVGRTQRRSIYLGLPKSGLTRSGFTHLCTIELNCNTEEHGGGGTHDQDTVAERWDNQPWFMTSRSLPRIAISPLASPPVKRRLTIASFDKNAVFMYKKKPAERIAQHQQPNSTHCVYEECRRGIEDGWGGSKWTTDV